MINTSYASFLKKCWDFLKYLLDFFRDRKQEQVNKIDIDLQNQYNKIDQDKEDDKQNDTEDRLNNMFK